MKLSYRGVAYQSNFAVIQTTETGQVGLFLGLSYPLRRPVFMPPQSIHALRYRGISYWTANELS